MCLLQPLLCSDLGNGFHICLSHSILIASASLGTAESRMQKPERWGEGSKMGWEQGEGRLLHHLLYLPFLLPLRQRQDLFSNQPSQMTSPSPGQLSKTGNMPFPNSNSSGKTLFTKSMALVCQFEFLKYFIKVLFILITECFATPLNFAPEADASLFSPLS